MAARTDIGNVDAALQELGPNGKYTLVQFSMQVLAQIAVAHHILSIVFTGQRNPFRCPTTGSSNRSALDQFSNLSSSSDANTSWPPYDSVCPGQSHEADEKSSIFNNSGCNAFNVEYELPKDRFFVSEFDLVCDREYLAGLTQTLLTLGHAVGSILVTYFADNYGRKPVLLLCSFLWCGSAIGLAFSVNYTMLAVLKTLVGLFLQGVAQTGATLMVEVLTGQQRGYMFGCLAYISWTIGIMLLVPVAYVLRNHSWRVLELAYCSYFVFIILFVFFLDESIRWLAAKGFRERVGRLLEKACKWNGSNIENVMCAFYKDEIEMSPQNKVNGTSKLQKDKHISTINSSEEKSNCDEKGLESLKNSNDYAEKLNFLSFFKERKLRFYMTFCIVSWFFNNLIYYALILMSSSLSGSLYLNYFLNCVVELPSAVFIFFFIDRTGRKVCFAAFSATAGLSLLGLAITVAVSDQMHVLITILAITGKFGISGSYATLYTMTPELLPTTVRNTGLGIAFLSACVGGMLAPYAELLMSHVVYAPGVIFGTGSLMLTVWTFFLPETANRQLPQSLNDIEKWSLEITVNN